MADDGNFTPWDEWDKQAKGTAVELGQKYHIPDEWVSHSPQTQAMVEMNGGLYVPLPTTDRRFGAYGSPGTSWYDSANFYGDPTKGIGDFRKEAAKRMITKDGMEYVPIQDYIQTEQLLKPYAKTSNTTLFDKLIMATPGMMAGLGIAGGGNFPSWLTDFFGGGPGGGGGSFPEVGHGGSPGSGEGLFDDVFNWGGEYRPFTTDPSFTDLVGGSDISAGGFGGGINAGGLDGSMGDTLRNYISQMGSNNAFNTTTGGGFFNSISDFLRSPMIPGTNATGGNVLAGLANFFMRQQQQNALNNAANRSATLNDPMQQPQRFPFQLALNNLLLNPGGYSQTPYATGQTDLARQAFEANVSKFGPGGTTFNDYLKNFQNIQSQDFFKLAEQFMTAGGFTQGTGGAGNAFGNLAGQAANSGLNAFEGFGRLLSTPTPTNNNNNPFQITFNPIGNSSNFSV